MEEVRVLAPATVSNVVCGFDCLGFALEAPVDEMVIRRSTKKGILIINHGDFDLPSDPKENVAGVALLSMLDEAGQDLGFEIEITKRIKPGSGIGSSSASSCGAVVGANYLLGNKFSKLELVEFAMAGEQVASGARHADNVAPCIFGGFTLVRSTDPLDIVELEFPPFFATVIHPQIEIKTAHARTLLPTHVTLGDAVRQWGNLGSLVAGLAKGDHGLIARSMEDLIVEPVRKSLIPMFDQLKMESLRSGSLGGGISGSGPSVFMLSESRETAASVEVAMRAVYSETGLEFNTYVSRISPEGVRRA